MTYTPPPAGPPPAAAAQPSGTDRTQLFGIIGIVLAFCCPLAGIVLGILSLRDAGRFGNSKTLGYIAVALCVVTAITGAIYQVNR